MSNNKKLIILVVTSLLAVMGVFIAEQYVQANYLFKSICKVLLFVIIPIFYSKLINKNSGLEFVRVKRDSNLKWGFMLGAFAFVILIAGFAIFNRFIDFQSVVDELQNRAKITPANFIFVGLYITIFNSFLEEYFFRGYIFLSFYKSGKAKLGYLFSAVLFAVYHLAIVKTWFSPWIMVLAMSGLVVTGLLFNFVDVKSKSLLNSWIIHIFANSAIILVGMRLFRMI